MAAGVVVAVTLAALAIGCGIRPREAVHRRTQEPFIVSDPFPFFGARGARPAPSVDQRDFLFWNRWRDESISPSAFVSLEFESLEYFEARFGSNGYVDALLQKDAALYGGPEREHFFHVNPDCILHSYAVRELHLLVYESHRHITIRVAARPLRGEAQEEFVRRVMVSLLRKPATWHFFPTTAPDEAVRFSTMPDYRVDFSENPFSERAIGLSGAVVSGGLYFTFFRSMSRDGGGQFPGTHPLLDEGLLALWAKVRGSGTLTKH